MKKLFYLLTRWKKDETEFSVSLSFDGTNSKRCRIPKPVIDFLGDPKIITFEINGNNVKIVSGNKPKK